MSLDVYLISKTPVAKKGTGVFVREGGATKELTVEEVAARYPNAVIQEREYETDCVYENNITHNLCNMADKAGLYEVLWRADEQGYTKASQLIPLLGSGLDRLLENPEYYKQFNPSNGWGSYEGLVKFVRSYLQACWDYPEAEIEISR